jgi:hypothetical protein
LRIVQALELLLEFAILSGWHLALGVGTFWESGVSEEVVADSAGLLSNRQDASSALTAI